MAPKATTTAPAAVKPVAKKPVAKQSTKEKATKAARALKGGLTTSKRVFRSSVHFKRPVTLKHVRKPKYERRAVPHAPRLDKFSTLKHPLCTESAMKQIEDNNTLTFIVDSWATKRHIKLAVKQLYDITAIKVNTLVRPDGRKKAYVRLSADHEALEVANTIGII